MNVAVDVKLRNPQMHGQAESREALLSHGLDLGGGTGLRLHRADRVRA
jgi:hypothetical protein